MADFAVDDGMEAMQREPAEIPNETKGLRACLRCGLVKTTEQVRRRPTARSARDAAANRVSLHHSTKKWAARTANSSRTPSSPSTRRRTSMGALLRVPAAQRRTTPALTPRNCSTVSLMEPKESWLAKYYHLCA